MGVQFSSVQSLSHIQLFPTPWTAARQASLSITNSRSLLRLMSIESVMPSRVMGVRFCQILFMHHVDIICGFSLVCRCSGYNVVLFNFYSWIKIFFEKSQYFDSMNLGVYALVLVAERQKEHGKRPSVNEVMVCVATVTGSGSLRSLCSMLSIWSG